MIYIIIIYIGEQVVCVKNQLLTMKIVVLYVIKKIINYNI